MTPRKPAAPIVRVATPDEREAVLATIVLAFSTDPILRWILPEPDAYLRFAPRFFAALGGRAFEHGSAWRTEDGRGASLWLPPGVGSDGEALGGIVREALEPARLEELGEFMAGVFELHPEEAHWYLPIIGVDPAGQGGGLGSALLARTLERVDEDGIIAYLESSNVANVPLYERHGFEVVAELQKGTSPTMYPMLRAAR